MNLYTEADILEAVQRKLDIKAKRHIQKLEKKVMKKKKLDVARSMLRSCPCGNLYPIKCALKRCGECCTGCRRHR